MIELQISEVRKQAPNRPPGYFEDVMAAGTISGESVFISSRNWARLIEKYRPVKFLGLGDLIFWILKPLPKWLKPKNCKCEARRAWLNRVFPLK